MLGIEPLPRIQMARCSELEWEWRALLICRALSVWLLLKQSEDQWPQFMRLTTKWSQSFKFLDVFCSYLWIYWCEWLMSHRFHLISLFVAVVFQILFNCRGFNLFFLYYSGSADIWSGVWIVACSSVPSCRVWPVSRYSGRRPTDSRQHNCQRWVQWTKSSVLLTSDVRRSESKTHIVNIYKNIFRMSSITSLV